MRRSIILATGALINFLIINTASANECWRIERQLNEAERKLRQGGNASYMKMWRQSRDHNAEELPKCRRRFGAGEPSITLYNGSDELANNHYNEESIPIDTDNPQLQQVIKTCNYWIQQNNQHATENTRAMRNTACENVHRMRREIELNKGKPAQEFRVTRPLKECVKPNNKIDNEVKLCMQGLKEPAWVTFKN